LAAGSLLMRIGVFDVGMASPRDPRYSAPRGRSACWLLGRRMLRYPDDHPSVINHAWLLV
jgi:hypothetical protein